MFSVIYRYVIQYKKNVNYFYLSFIFHFSWFSFLFFLFFEVYCTEIFSALSDILPNTALALSFSFSSWKFSFSVSVFFLYLILTLKLTILVIYRACGSVRVLCLCAFCCVSFRLALSFFPSQSLSFFLSICFFSSAVLHVWVLFLT